MPLQPVLLEPDRYVIQRIKLRGPGLVVVVTAFICVYLRLNDLGFIAGFYLRLILFFDS